MTQLDEKTIDAIIYLKSLDEFSRFLVWIASSINILHLQNVTSTGQQRDWNQGRLQELYDLQSKIEDATRLKQLIRESRGKAIKNPDI